MRDLIRLAASILICNNSITAQVVQKNPFQKVIIPDSISIKLEKAYKEITGGDSVNAGRNVWNLLSGKSLVFENGLYTFKGQGPHFPRRLFIFNNGNLFVFTSNNINKVLKEYSGCIDSLQLSEAERIRYLKRICSYLYDELDETYGAEVK